LFSCNPVKRVLKNREMFDKVAKEAVRQGYCVNDTTVVTTVKDTVYVHTSSSIDTIFVGSDCEIDTILDSGTRIRVADGMLIIDEKIYYKTREVIRNVDRYIRDTKMEDILKQDIADRDRKISNLQGMMSVYLEEIEKLKKESDKYRWYFIGLSVLVTVGFTISVLRFIKII
jgi:hypothetical protein